jgi:hypothetical protein
MRGSPERRRRRPRSTAEALALLNPPVHQEEHARAWQQVSNTYARYAIAVAFSTGLSAETRQK